MMRRNRKKIIIRSRHILIFGFILCLVLIFVSYRYEEELAPVKAAVNNVISPMQRGINTIGKYISDKLDMLTNIQTLLDENDKLKKDIADLKSVNQTLAMEKDELDTYRELYELGEQYTDYNKVSARVIGKDPSSYYNVFIIDKGSNDGMAVDMNILAGGGLAGIIIEVGDNWAKVRSIIDDSSNVSGMFLKSSDLCIVRGDLELLDSGYIRVEKINMDAEIYDNYEIVTSHVSRKFLPGILIGYVSHIETDSSNITKKAYVTPVVDFEHLKSVLVITDLREELKGLEGFEDITE